MPRNGYNDESLHKNTPPGPGVDATGQAVIDPTQNVLQLVQAAVERLDNLREMEASHVREILQIRTDHDKAMRENESRRLDAIRSVDVEQVARAAEVQTTVATALASQVALSAEAVRNQVAATATASATALAAALAPLTEAIADLRRVQYEQAGSRAQVVETGDKTRTNTGLYIAAAAVLSSGIIGVVAVIVTVLLANGIFSSAP